MKTKQEVKRDIMRRIMELRTKDMIEEDCILDVLDDNLDPYITELEDNLDQATEIIKFLINPQLLDKPQYYEWRLKAEKFIKG